MHLTRELVEFWMEENKQGTKENFKDSLKDNFKVNFKGQL